jgi:hypothetical protein
MKRMSAPFASAVGKSRSVMLLALCAFASAGAQRRASVDDVRIITSDVANFWSALDRATPYDLDARLRDDYLGRASSGLRAFAPTQIGSALDLARSVYQRRADYDRVRAATLSAGATEPALRAAMLRLRALYPDAVLLDVYFVVGRFAVGGWTRGDTLVVATEMYPDTAMLPRIVAHELVHRQQPPATPDQTLLERAFNEGAADFIGELASGGTINPEAQRYGGAHERALWREFRRVMNGHDYGAWLYGRHEDGRPADLGYFFGYRIAQSYYERASDKARAIREIMETRDVPGVLRRSGYAP